MTAVLTPRIAGYPILAPGRIDYVDEHEYEIEHGGSKEQSKNSIEVLHRVRGTNLVSQLVAEGKATFATTIVSSTCAYRKVEVAIGRPDQINGCIQLYQQIELSTEQFSYPVMFQPSVITNSAVNRLLIDSSHGVDDLWLGMEINIPIAAFIATQTFLSAKSPVQSILRLKKDSQRILKRGSFEVEAVPEEGFYFLVTVAEDLFGSLRNPASFEHRDSLYSMAFSQGLDILRKEYCDQENWQEYQHLRMLNQMLKKKSLLSWEEEGFKPNQVAAAFHPHKLKSVLNQEGEAS